MPVQQGNSKRSREALMPCSAQQSDELRALANPDFWLKEQAKTADIDKQLARARGF